MRLQTESSMKFSIWTQLQTDSLMAFFTPTWVRPGVAEVCCFLPLCVHLTDEASCWLVGHDCWNRHSGQTDRQREGELFYCLVFLFNWEWSPTLLSNTAVRTVRPQRLNGNRSWNLSSFISWLLKRQMTCSDEFCAFIIWRILKYHFHEARFFLRGSPSGV